MPSRRPASERSVHTTTAPPRDPAPFTSLRWRVLLPFSLLLAVVMLGAFLLGAGGMTPAARQINGLLASALGAAAVIAVYWGLESALARISRVRRTALDLAAGSGTARTQFTSADEIGQLGRALDRYADSVQERYDALRVSLRRQRREIEHMTAALDTIADGVFVLAPNGEVVLMNAAVRAWTNGSPAALLEVIKTSLEQTAAREADDRRVRPMIADFPTAGVIASLVALGGAERVIWNDRAFDLTRSALMSWGNERSGTVIVLRDVTEKVEREHARRRYANLRMSLTAAPPASTAQQAAVELAASSALELKRSAANLQKLVVELRDLLWRQEAHSQRLELDVAALVWAVANDWRQVATASDLRLDISITQRGLSISGDERRLRWALGNIVDNAVKYTPAGGVVALEVGTVVDGYVPIHVRDSGVGIAPDDLEQIFEPFYRGHPHQPDGAPLTISGQGQGLKTARAIFGYHGGHLDVQSRLGTGAIVTVWLPVLAIAPAAVSQPASGGAAQVGGDQFLDTDDEETYVLG